MPEPTDLYSKLAAEARELQDDCTWEADQVEYVHTLADAIDALTAENQRLKEALAWIAGLRPSGLWTQKARTALAKKEPSDEH